MFRSRGDDEVSLSRLMTERPAGRKITQRRRDRRARHAIPVSQDLRRKVISDGMMSRTYIRQDLFSQIGLQAMPRRCPHRSNPSIVSHPCPITTYKAGAMVKQL